MKYIYYNDDNFYYDCGVPEKISDERKRTEVYKEIEGVQKTSFVETINTQSNLASEVRVLNVDHLPQFKILAE